MVIVPRKQWRTEQSHCYYYHFSDSSNFYFDSTCQQVCQATTRQWNNEMATAPLPNPWPQLCLWEFCQLPLLGSCLLHAKEGKVFVFSLQDALFCLSSTGWEGFVGNGAISYSVCPVTWENLQMRGFLICLSCGKRQILSRVSTLMLWTCVLGGKRNNGGFCW